MINGILDLQINARVASGDIQGAFHTTLYSATTAKLGIADISKAATHIMYCLPNVMYAQSVSSLPIWRYFVNIALVLFPSDRKRRERE